jgi:hypothetical protein
MERVHRPSAAFVQVLLHLSTRAGLEELPQPGVSKADDRGLTDACRTVLRNAGTAMTPSEDSRPSCSHRMRSLRLLQRARSDSHNPQATRRGGRTAHRRRGRTWQVGLSVGSLAEHRNLDARQRPDHCRNRERPDTHTGEEMTMDLGLRRQFFAGDVAAVANLLSATRSQSTRPDNSSTELLASSRPLSMPGP